MTKWSKDELRKVDEADDLHIAPRAAIDGHITATSNHFP